MLDYYKHPITQLEVLANNDYRTAQHILVDLIKNTQSNRAIYLYNMKGAQVLADIYLNNLRKGRIKLVLGPFKNRPFPLLYKWTKNF